MESLPKRPLSPQASLARTKHLKVESITSTAPRDVPVSAPTFTHHLPPPSLSSPPPAPPPFQQPSPLFTYSMAGPSDPSGHRILLFDNSAAASFAPPPMNANLDEGFERCVWRDEIKSVKEGVDGLVRGLERLEGRTGGNKVLGKGKEGFVTWRGVLTKLITAPYEDRNSWELNAMLAPDGNIYVENHKTPDKSPSLYGENPRQKRMTYYGYSFESYCTIPPASSSQSHVRRPDSSNKAKGWGSDVDTNSEWCVVVKTALAGVRLVLGGEVDCVEGTYNGTLRNAIELKTNRLIRSDRDEVFFEKKLLKHWAQSFLLSIPTIMIGFRSDRPPTIQSVQTFRTMDIPRLVRDKPGGWQPGVCLNFGKQALEFIRGVVRDGEGDGRDTGKTVWRIKFAPLKGLEMRPLDASEIPELESGRPPIDNWIPARWGFLPGWMAPNASRVDTNLEADAQEDHQPPSP
ncbi:Nuclear 5'-3' exoribonuclease-interacting protein, Rai1p [Phaffia rhodozyma]|uniref:Decapping nuclease n=1 Tax=Phaffia rhodozyma TaxID=264483 RepID=A0A0F7SLF6_PHARH|nr:Nuclear 5'-3' exoribonuclease-interacting protein, Rai1p [Phaffia rhodozyma]